MKNYLFFVALLFSSLAFAQLPNHIDPVAAGFSEDRLQRFADYLHQEIEASKIPGAVCLIARKGAIAYEGTFGYKSISDNSPMQKDQIFYIQSMTKPIVSVAFMMLYEEGYFQLDDPVHKYLPQFKEMKVLTDEKDEAGKPKLVATDQPITIEHLLTHTAGFSHGLGNSEIDLKYRAALYGNTELKTIKDRANELSKLPLVGQPGEQWYYSASPDVISLLIEQFSGMTTAQFLQQRIFDPLNMKDTGYNLADEKKERAVGLHAKSPEGKLFTAPQQTPTSGHTIFGGTHGLFSTAQDYMKFCLMLLNDGTFDGKRLLSRKTIEWMRSNHVGDKYGKGEGFGLGFSVRTNLADGENIGSLGEYAWSGAFNTYFFIDPQEELVAIMMMQMWPYTSYYKRKFKQFVYQAIND